MKTNKRKKVMLVTLLLICSAILILSTTTNVINMSWLESETKVIETGAATWLGISSAEYLWHCGDESNFLMLTGALDGDNYWSHNVNEIHKFYLDLGANYNIQKMRSRSIRNEDPTDVDLYISMDNKTWGSAVATGISTWQDTSAWVEVDHTDKVGRYIWVDIQATEDLRFNHIEWGETGLASFPIFDVYAELYAPNNPPVFSNENPANNSGGNDLDLIWNVTIADPDGDTFDWSIECNNSQSDSDTSDTNGSKTLSLTGLSLITQYTIWVNATDGIDDTNETFYFVTRNNNDSTIISESPANESTEIEPEPELSVIVDDTDNDWLNVTWWSNSSGAWLKFGTNASISTAGGSVNISQDNINFTDLNTTYYWSVNCSDGINFTNATFHFTTVVPGKIIFGQLNGEGGGSDPLYDEVPANGSKHFFQPDGFLTEISIDYTGFTMSLGKPPSIDDGQGIYFNGNLSGLDYSVYYNSISLNNTHGVTLYAEDDFLNITLLHFENDNVSFGNQYNIFEFNAGTMDIQQINSTHFIIIYETDENMDIELIVCKLNEDETVTIGNTIEVGTLWDGLNMENILDLDSYSNEVILLFQNVSGNEYYTLRHITIDDLNITFNNNLSRLNYGDNKKIRFLNGTEFVLGFTNTSAWQYYNGTLILGTINGGLDIYDEEYLLYNGNPIEPNEMQIERRIDNYISIFYRNETDGDYSSYMQMGYYNGTGIEIGDLNLLLDWQTTDLDNFEHTWINENRLVGAYQTIVHDDALACVGSYISFDEIMFSPAFEIDTNTTNEKNYAYTKVQILKMNDTHFCIAYKTAKGTMPFLYLFYNLTIGYLADFVSVEFGWYNKSSSNWEYYGLGIMGICQNQTILMFNSRFSGIDTYWWRVSAQESDTGTWHNESYNFTTFYYAFVSDSPSAITWFAFSPLGCLLFIWWRKRKNENDKYY